MFDGFETNTVETSGAAICVTTGGGGPPVLLLHGYPQTHAMWHKVAPELADAYTVYCPDLRGYGDSGKVEGDQIRCPFHAWRFDGSGRCTEILEEILHSVSVPI